jgi:glyoxylase-like metal-dependent hydrolase (beta-lactamase superfamily II)
MSVHARTTVDCDLLPRFTAVYLREAGDACAFIEAHTPRAVPKMMAALAARGRRPEEIRFVVVTHAHLDHAAGASALLARCPNATLLAHPRTVKHLVDPRKLVEGARAVYGAARFAELYGEVEPVPAARARSLADGESFELGDARLTAHHTAGHAWHHLVIHDPALESVYTGDAFGLVYPALQRAKRFAIASTSPTGFDAAEAHKSIDKILSLGARAACLTHFDEVRDPAVVGAQLRAWIDRSEAWVEACVRTGRSVAEADTWIEQQLRVALVEEAGRAGLILNAADWGTLRLDVELNAQGLAYAASQRGVSAP